MLSGPLDAPYAGVAWVSVVVGLHFFPLATLFDLPPFRWLGAGIAGFGVVGLALAAGGAGQAPVAAVGGVLPGALLLMASWWGATHQHLTARRRPAAE